jgi:hypothetical protein
MRAAQKWLASGNRLKGVLNGEALPDDLHVEIPSRLWPNLPLAEFPFLHGAGTRKQWQDNLFIPLLQALLSPLPPKQG